MPHLNYFVVASSAVIDAHTNALSIFHVKEILQPRKLPREVPRIVALCSWVATEGDLDRDFSAIVRMHLPGESRHVDSEAINFGFKDHAHARLRFLSLGGRAVSQAGILRFELLLNASPVAEYWVTITEPRASASED